MTLPNPLLVYHERTKHRFEAYAQGPGQLDWDAQPSPFRHYFGAPVFELPLSASRFERAFGQLSDPLLNPVEPDLESLGSLLELAFGISAWKSWAGSRWALRCNPSSGNLHPVEAYVLASGCERLPNGLLHYDPEQHALEGRSLCARPQGGRWLAVGLSSILWREAWKYGERAFRYCQLDIGHALGALAYSAALLGWRLRPIFLPAAALAGCLGLDRAADFPDHRYAFTEREEAECLVLIEGPGLGGLPERDEILDWLADGQWSGMPSCVDPAPGYRWAAVEQAALLSRATAPSRLPEAVGPPAWPSLPIQAHPQGAASLIRQRRSGQRFDPAYQLPAKLFFRMLDALLPRANSPWQVAAVGEGVHLLLFVLRVDGLSPGLYYLQRSTREEAALAQALGRKFPALTPVQTLHPDCPQHLKLQRLAAVPLKEMQRLARSLSCHQDIASNGAFSLGMLACLSPEHLADPHAYRQQLRGAGLLGQVLYLEAEAVGARGTGIGCYFDDPVSDCAGLAGSGWQSIYHFTVGHAVEDARLSTEMPYPGRR